MTKYCDPVRPSSFRPHAPAMTLAAPAPTLPLFATIDHEPALEGPAPVVDGEWVVEGDVPFSVEQSHGAAREVRAAPGPEGASAAGRAAVEGAGVTAGVASPAVWESRTPARKGSNGTDGSRPAVGPSDDRLRRERERALLARRRAELVVRTALEVLDGRRPVSHLAPFAAPEVLRYVNAGVPRRGRTAAAGASLRSLHVSLPGRAAAEVAAVCRFGTRVRALAARLELTGQGEWRCVALRVI